MLRLLLTSLIFFPAAALASDAETVVQAFDDFCIGPEFNQAKMEQVVLAQGGVAVPPENANAKDLDRPEFQRTENAAWQLETSGVKLAVFHARYEADHLNQKTTGPLDDCQIIPQGVAASALNVVLQKRYGEHLTADTVESETGGMTYHAAWPFLSNALIHVRSDGKNGTLELYRDEDW